MFSNITTVPLSQKKCLFCLFIKQFINYYLTAHNLETTDLGTRLNSVGKVKHRFTSISLHAAYGWILGPQADLRPHGVRVDVANFSKYSFNNNLIALISRG